MKINTIIMAQGKQTRMGSLAHPKQLLVVNGEPLLARSLRLFGSAVTVCWPSLGLWAADIQGFVRYSLPRPGNCILQGLAAARRLWRDHKGRTLVLLGDVFYTEAAAEAILRDPRPLFFAGTSNVSPSEGELFAFSFVNSEGVWDALEKRACRGVEHKAYQNGHLRNLLWHYGGGISKKRRRPANFSRVFLPIDDGTRDFDTAKDLSAGGASVLSGKL